MAATVAAAAPGALLPEAAAKPPSDFLCPISQELMIRPVVLVETGHSYEAANIQRWLSTHNMCPVSRQQLTSKQMVTNYSLRRLIADWADTHGIILPPAPTFTPLHIRPGSYSTASGPSVGSGASFLAAACVGPRAGSTGFSDIAVAVDDQQQQQHLAAQSPFEAALQHDVRSQPAPWLPASEAVSSSGGVFGPGAGLQKDDNIQGGTSAVAAAAAAPSGGWRGAATTPPVGGRGRRRMCGPGFWRCTRTKWALSILAVILVVAALGLGVGVSFAVRGRQGEIV